MLDPLTATQKSGGGLEYPRLDPYLDGKGAEVRSANSLEPRLWVEFSDSPMGSVREAIAGRELAKLSLLNTARQNIVLPNLGSGNKDIWASRVTTATEELYDSAIDHDIWIGLFATSLRQDLERAKHSPEIQGYVREQMGLYKELGIGLREVMKVDVNSERYELPKVHGRYKAYLRDRFRSVICLVTEDYYNPDAMSQLFTSVMDKADIGDQDWKIVQDSQKANLQVTAAEKKIVIGGKRKPTSREAAKGLIAHELLTHVLRAKRGFDIGDLDLVRGLPGYLEAEEGLAIINAGCVRDEDPKGMIHRYIDIGIAQGMLGTVPSINDLSTIVCLRKRINRPNLSESVAMSQAVNSVARMYRGGPGNLERGEPQAVFTKAATYLKGYIKMVQWINNQIEQDVPTAYIFAYLYAGKFDPTDELHAEYIQRSAPQIARRVAQQG